MRSQGRRPPLWLVRWRDMARRVFFWMGTFDSVLSGLAALQTKRRITDRLSSMAVTSASSGDPCDSGWTPTFSTALMSLSTPGISSTLMSESGYPNSPETCSHPNTRGYSAPRAGSRSGTYRICDSCGQRWLKEPAGWINITPKAKPVGRSPPGPGVARRGTGGPGAASSAAPSPPLPSPPPATSAAAAAAKPRPLPVQTKARSPRPPQQAATSSGLSRDQAIWAQREKEWAEFCQWRLSQGYQPAPSEAPEQHFMGTEADPLGTEVSYTFEDEQDLQDLEETDDMELGSSVSGMGR